MTGNRRVRPNPQMEHLPTGSNKQCNDILQVDIDGIRHSFECMIQEIPLRDPNTSVIIEQAHPNQPHMARLTPADPANEDVFIGWYRSDDQLTS